MSEGTTNQQKAKLRIASFREIYDLHLIIMGQQIVLVEINKQTNQRLDSGRPSRICPVVFEIEVTPCSPQY